ncbi:MAG TPA: hypothetical protein VF735_15165 [Pyrinomonadaceae bacterium]|jgi:hypothetical protein
MQKQIAKYRNQLSIVAALAFACLLLLTVSVASSNNSLVSNQSEGLQIDNKTQAFQIISSEINNGVVTVSLRNGYSKTINGFTLGDSESSGIQIDFTSTDSAIAPGENYQYKIPLRSIQSSLNSAENNKFKLKVLSVVFDDGSSDGDYHAIVQMKNRRHGEKVQLARIIPLLNKALASSDADIFDALSRLKSQISALSIEPENGQPAEIVGGLHHGKEDALAQIRALEERQMAQGNLDLRQGLLAIKKRFEKKAPKL